jgi:hypothetical protein
LNGRLPGLITGTQDAAVLAIYLGTLFALAIAAAAFAMSLIVTWLARRAGASLSRRARSLSLLAGAAVAAGCLVYLTLWWQTASAVPGWSAPVRTVFALAVAAAISLLMGHAVTVTALAVIVAASGTDAAVPGARPATWRSSIAAGALAFAGAAVLLVFSAPADSAGERNPPLTVVSSGSRVRVLAIDGFDPAVFEELRAAGKVPALSDMLGQATATLQLPDTDDEARDPARAWTTIATGQPVERHRVYGLQTRRVAGVQGRVPVERSTVLRAISAATDVLRLTRPAIASGSERQEKTFWEVAAEAGLRTVVVNWWATWPASSRGGIVLSDRATLRLEHGGKLDAEIAPPAVYDRLRQRWPAIKEEAARIAGRAIETSPGVAELRPLLVRSIELDADQIVLASELDRPDTDLTVIYLPGLDIAQHALFNRREGDASASPSALAMRLQAIQGYYVALDRLLAEIPAREDAVGFVITAPGRVAGAGVARLGARGPMVRDGAAVRGNVTDVSPTILYTLGLPLSRGLAGVPLTAVFTEAFTAKYPLRHVDTYGRPQNDHAPREGQPLDQEMIDRLRSLGYVR